MKKRLKMILTSAMLAFCLALMGFGVYAASSHTLGVENTISFDIEDNISFSIKAERTAPTGSLGSRTTLKHYYNQTNAQGGNAIEVGMADNDGKLSAWTMSDPVLLYAGETITWDFTIVNKGGNPFYINMIDATNPWGNNATLTAESNVLVQANQTPVIFTITFKVADAPTFNSNTSSQALSFGIKLSKEQISADETLNTNPIPVEELTFNLITDAKNGNYYEISATNTDVEGVLVIPSTYTPGTSTYSMSPYASTSYPVRAIADHGFKDCNGLTGVDFTNATNLDIIGEFAFSGCPNLSSLDMSTTNITIIDYAAFQNCYNLRRITFPSSIIGYIPNMIDGCYSLSYITNYPTNKMAGIDKLATMYDSDRDEILNDIIKETIEDVKISYKLVNFDFVEYQKEGSQVFYTMLERYNTAHIKTFTSNSLEVSIETVGDYEYINLDGDKLLFGFKEGLTNKTVIKNIASDITGVYKYAFYKIPITSIDLSGCTVIKDVEEDLNFEYMFDYDDNNVTSINLSNTNIDRLRFSFDQSFHNLKSIDLSGCTALMVIDGAFAGCSNLTTIDLSDCIALTTIASDTFVGCDNLTTVILPSSAQGNTDITGNIPTGVEIQYK